MIFRNTRPSDVDQMVRIAEEGRARLKEKGVSQWQRGTYPDRALFLSDAEEKIGYVLTQKEDGTEEEEVLAILAVTFTDEASYRNPLSGKWLTMEDASYATIHRMAVAAKHTGKNLSGTVFEEVKKMAKQKGAQSIRIDTHPDNLTMQRTLLRSGFLKCTEFLIAEGDEAGDLRFGYELLL